MFGYPRRHTPKRRSAPTVTLFDPSADAFCCGWWRTDAGLTISDADHALASAWTSRLPSAHILTGAYPWIYSPSTTKGFPSIYGQGYDTWSGVAGAEDGDRDFTLTFVCRMPRWIGAQDQLLCYMPRWGGVAMTNAWMRMYHPYAGYNWNFFDAIWFPASYTEPLVFTLRITSEDVNTIYYAAAYNNHHAGPVQQNTGWGDRVMEETDNIYLYANQNHVIWHEIITHRRYLSTAEVTAMHLALMTQYGVTE